MTIPPSHITIKEKKKDFFKTVIHALQEYYMPYPSENDPHTIAAKAFQDFLDGKHDSLDKAFGLINPEGVLATDVSYKQEVVFRALAENEKGIPYTQIPEVLKININEKTIRNWRDENPIPEFGGKGKLHVLYLLSRA